MLSQVDGEYVPPSRMSSFCYSSWYWLVDKAIRVLTNVGQVLKLAPHPHQSSRQLFHFRTIFNFQKKKLNDWERRLFSCKYSQNPKTWEFFLNCLHKLELEVSDEIKYPLNIGLNHFLKKKLMDCGPTRHMVTNCVLATPITRVGHVAHLVVLHMFFNHWEGWVLGLMAIV